MRRNTLSFATYLTTSLYCCIAWLFLQINTFFHAVFDLPHTPSVIIFVGLAVLGWLVGFLTTFRTRRNYVSILCTVALTFGPYFLVSFWPFARSPLTTAGQITAVLLACYSLLIFLTYVADRRAGTTTASFGKCVFSCLRANARLFLVLLGLLLCFVMLKTSLHIPLLSPSHTAADTASYTTKQDAIYQNADVLLPLVDGTWDQLTTAERLDILSVIGSIEAAHLHIPEVSMGADLFDERILAHYIDVSHTISINLAYLSTLSPYAALATFCHEYAHAYQHQLILLYDTLDADARAMPFFADVAQYKFEFGNYINGVAPGSHGDYQSQLCERHSDTYGEIAADSYIALLNQYLAEQQHTPG